TLVQAGKSPRCAASTIGKASGNRRSERLSAPMNTPASKKARSSLGLIDSVLPSIGNITIESQERLQFRQLFDLNILPFRHLHPKRLLFLSNLAQKFIQSAILYFLYCHRSCHQLSSLSTNDCGDFQRSMGLSTFG